MKFWSMPKKNTSKLRNSKFLSNSWPIHPNQNNIQHYQNHIPQMNSPTNVSTSYSNGESYLNTNEEITSVYSILNCFNMGSLDT